MRDGFSEQKLGASRGVWGPKLWESMKDAEGNPISEITVSQKMFEPISILNRSQNIQYSFLGVLTIYIYYNPISQYEKYQIVDWVWDIW